MFAKKWLWCAIAAIAAFLIIWLSFVLAQHTHLEDSRFQLNPVQFFTFILSSFTFLLIVAAVLVYRDRRAMQEEYDRRKIDLEVHFKSLEEIQKTKSQEMITTVDTLAKRAVAEIERECNELKGLRAVKEKEIKETVREFGDFTEKTKANIAGPASLLLILNFRVRKMHFYYIMMVSGYTIRGNIRRLKSSYAHRYATCQPSRTHTVYLVLHFGS